MATILKEHVAREDSNSSKNFLSSFIGGYYPLVLYIVYYLVLILLVIVCLLRGRLGLGEPSGMASTVLEEAVATSHPSLKMGAPTTDLFFFFGSGLSRTIRASS